MLELINQPRWFALGVKPRHEQAVARALRTRQLEEFAPVYRERRDWCDRVKLVDFPLFAGYVFCRFGYSDRHVVLNTPGVTAILGAGKVFSPISDEQIATLRTIAEAGMPARPCPYLAPGQMVRVERGPLAGFCGSVLRTRGATFVVISVELLQRSVAVDIPYDAVRPLFLPSQISA